MKTLYMASNPYGVNLNDAGLQLVAPFWHNSMQGTTFYSKDLNHLTLTATGATWGKTGRSFDGDDSIDAGTNSVFDFTSENFTILSWVNPSLLVGTTRTLVSRSNIGSDGYLARVTDEGRIDFLTWSPGEGRTYTAVGVISINTPYLVTFVRQGTAALLYRNDALINNESSGTHNNPASSNQSLLMGASATPASSGYWVGTFGVALIYSRALSASEIQNIYLSTRWRYQ